MAPAPAVTIDRTDPISQQATTKAHLLDVFARYGPAVYMLNLIRLVRRLFHPVISVSCGLRLRVHFCVSSS